MSNLKREYVKYIKKLLKPQEPMGKYKKDNKISEFKNEKVKNKEQKREESCYQVNRGWGKPGLRR